MTWLTNYPNANLWLFSTKYYVIFVLIFSNTEEKMRLLTNKKFVFFSNWEIVDLYSWKYKINLDQCKFNKEDWWDWPYEWENKSKLERKMLLLKFCKTKRKKEDKNGLQQSTNGKLLTEIPSSSAGKKPGQRKRRVKTVSFKRSSTWLCLI